MENESLFNNENSFYYQSRSINFQTNYYNNEGKHSPFIFTNPNTKRSPFIFIEPQIDSNNNLVYKRDPFIYDLKWFSNEDENLIKDYTLSEYNYKMPEFADADHLSESFNTLRSANIKWKKSAQTFRINRLKNITSLVTKINTNTYKPSKPNEFIEHERGRTRYIKANTIEDKTIQKSFCNNVLLPIIKSKLIYDNGASVKDKGISFSRKRFEIHVRKAYKEYNKNGYILFIDFSKYFDNIIHSCLFNMIEKYLTEDQINFLKISFSEFRINLSFMNDEEFKLAKNSVFNMLDYSNYIKSNNINLNKYSKDKMLDISVGIGNEISQAVGIFYPHKLDNFCKIVKGIKYYGRYMDDTYIISNSKECLYSLLEDIDNICKEIGIHINKKKTHIIPLSSQYTYLKIKYFFNKKGKLIRIPVSSNFRRMRKRASKYIKLVKKNRISIIDFINSYLSWRGTYNKFDCGYEMKKLDEYIINISKPYITNKDQLLKRKNLKLIGEDNIKPINKKKKYFRINKKIKNFKIRYLKYKRNPLLFSSLFLNTAKILSSR